MSALEVGIIRDSDELKILPAHFFLFQAHHLEQHVTHGDASVDAVAYRSIRPLESLDRWEFILDSCSLASSADYGCHDGVARHLFDLFQI